MTNLEYTRTEPKNQQAEHAPADQALYLAGLGWYVFPCKTDDKRPIIESAHPEGDPLHGICRGECGKEGHGLYDATTDPEKIRAWWQRWPGALIGINCGRSGFFAVDIDALEAHGVDGWAAWEMLEDQHGRAPIGPAQDTKRKGRHIVYKQPEGRTVGSKSGNLPPGIDVKGAGGYIVTGPGYTWLEGHKPGEPIPEAPAWLLKLILGEDRRNGHKRAEPIGEAIPQGGRNQTLISLAGSMRRRGMSPEAIDAALQAENLVRCDPPLDPEEVTRIARSIERYPPAEGDFMTSLPADHDGHAQALVLLYPNRFLYCPAYGWMHNTGTHWEREGAEEHIERAILDTLRRRRFAAMQTNPQLEHLVKATAGSAHNINGTKTALREKVLALVDDFDKDPDLLNCQNGVVHLPTGTLLERRPDHLFTYCVTVDYDPQADADLWIDFLLAAVDGNGDFMNYLQAAAGYSLTGHTREEVLFYLYGPTRSGKGTFTEAMLEMLGRRSLATEADFSTFVESRDQDVQNFALAPLKACRFVVASESNKYNALNPAKIKQITGGNDIRCAFKHRDHFTYRPQFKLWLVSNHPVNTDVDDDAAWGRVKVILFPVSHLGHEDKALKYTLKQPEHLRGVLRWAVEGARLWYSMPRGLEDPPALRAETERHRAEADYIAAFLEECTETTEGAFIANKTLYTLYETWCKETGVTPKGQRLFSQGMKRKGYQDGTKFILGRTTRGFYGLHLAGAEQTA